MPLEYADALKERENAFEENLKAIQQANLTDEQCRLLQKNVDQGFKEWLHFTGNIKQLEHLTIINPAQTQPIN